MNKEEIFKRIPKITNKQIKECNRYFTPYLFYTTLKNDDKECWCTSCNKHYTWSAQRKKSQSNYDFLAMSHNNTGKCKKCGTTVRYKNIGKARGRKNLYEKRCLVIVQKLNYNKVFLRAFYVTKNYDYELLPSLNFSETERFYLTPGKVRRWKNNYYYTTCGQKNSFYEIKKIGEPFNMSIHPTYYYFGEKYNHFIINKYELKRTFLKYSQLDTFVCRIDSYYYIQHIIKYLCFYAKYPAAEMMLKLGLYDFVEKAVIEDKPNKRVVNWNGKTPQEIFKINKQEFNELRQSESPDMVNLLKYYKQFKKQGRKISIADIAFLQNVYEREVDCYFKSTFEFGFKLFKLHNYFKKQPHNKTDTARSFHFWLDYINMAKKINYDLTNEVVLLPKNLQAKHDETVNVFNALQNEIKEKLCKKLQAKRKRKYPYSDGEYMIIVPPNLQSIIDEGKALQHCVGGYTDRHAEGKLTILFMRSCADPDKPLYTIEISTDDKVRQAYGFKNQSTPPKDFINKWLAEIEQRKKKAKFKNIKQKPAQPAAV